MNRSTIDRCCGLLFVSEICLAVPAINQRNADDTGDLLDLGELLALLFTQTDLANHFGMGFQLDLRGQGVLQIQLHQNGFHNVVIFGGFQPNNRQIGLADPVKQHNGKNTNNTDRTDK